MHYLDVELDDPAANLAVDEALLLEAEAGPGREVIRFWEFARPAAVLGRASKAEDELDLAYCRREAVAVLRRCSGGATILAGPGCLMYSLVLSLRARPELRGVDAAHRFVMSRLSGAVGRRLPGVAWQGTCDLTWRDRKFSGNSLRVARHHLLYHGTLLYSLAADKIERCLKTPPRQPEYRRARPHGDFVTNVPLSRHQLRMAAIEAFEAVGALEAWPADRADRLARERYSDVRWTLRH